MSEDSNKYEVDIAKYIDKSLPGLSAERPKRPVAFPDVRVEYKQFSGTDDKKVIWVEVKMNHTDNLMNSRFQYITNTRTHKGVWSCTPAYVSEASDILVNLLNNDKQTKKWIKDLKVFLSKQRTFKGSWEDISIYSTPGVRSTDKNSVSLDLMKKFLQTQPTKNFSKLTDQDIGNLVTLHYTKGKAVATYYVSAGDDFYQFGNKNPLKIPGIPVFKGKGNIVFRIGDRSGNFEVMGEIKMKSKMANSPYSVYPKTNKKNPFQYIGI